MAGRRGRNKIRPKDEEQKRFETKHSLKAVTSWNNVSTIKPATGDEERDYNTRQIQHILRIHEIASHADRADVNSLRSCFIAYLQLCQEDGFRISNLSAYASFGMSAQLFEYYLQRGEPEIKEFCQFVRATCAMARETLVSEGKLNPVIGIFWQRNYDGLRNDTEQVQSAHEEDAQDDAAVSKRYREKYGNLIGE